MFSWQPGRYELRTWLKLAYWTSHYPGESKVLGSNSRGPGVEEQMGNIRVGVHSTLINVWSKEENEKIATEEHRGLRNWFVREWILIQYFTPQRREMEEGQGIRDRE